jgi:hypothetical protein
MSSFHSAAFRLLGIEPQVSPAALADVERTERRLGFRFPPSIRAWYCNAKAIELLAKYSNQDWPIALQEFEVREWNSHRLLPFKNENQGVCVWAILLDGSNDPPVYVDVDSNGTQWTIHAPTFSAYIYACVWDYASVLFQPALVQAQNQPFATEAVNQLRAFCSEQLRTFGWPGNAQHRFEGEDWSVLIWSGEDQADWFIGAGDADSLETALRLVWNIDGVGKSLYDCSEIGAAVLHKIGHEGCGPP